MRYSIVVTFDFEKELKKFKLYTTAGTKGMATDKRDLLEKAILVTNDSSVTIDLKTMSQILTQFLKLPKLDTYTQDLLADEHFNKWIDLLQKGKEGAFKDMSENFPKHVADMS